MSFELADKRRDQRLRRQVLSLLKIGLVTSPNGRLAGRTILDELAIDLEDEQHLLRLLRELLVKGLLDERDRRKLKSDRFGLDHLDYAITARGQDLLAGNIPVDPDVDDERRGPEGE